MSAVVKEISVFRGRPLAVYGGGAGPKLLYLHGMLGNPVAHPFLIELAKTCEVVAPCLPGFNESAACEDLRGLHDWIVALSEIVDLCGCAGAPVVASSIGAMLALELASVRPEAFFSLTLIAPLGLWDEREPVADVFANIPPKVRAAFSANPAKTGAFFDDVDEFDPAAAIERGVQRFVTQSMAASLVWPIPEFGLSTRIHRVTHPTTLIWGTADAIAPLSYLDRFARALPGIAAVHRVEGAGHHVEWDAPAETAKLAGYPT